MPQSHSALSRYLFRSLGAIALAGLLFILASALWSWRATRTYTITYRLAPAQGAPSPDDLQRTAGIVARRLELLGPGFHISHASARAVAPDGVEVTLKARSAPDEALAWATMPCRVEFRLVHPRDPLPAGQVPEGYETKVYRDQQFLLSHAGDVKTVRHTYLVEKQPALVTHGVAGGVHRHHRHAQDGRADLPLQPQGRRRLRRHDGPERRPGHGDADRRGDVLPAEGDRRPDHGRRGADRRLLPAPPLRKLVKVLNTGALPGKLVETGRTVR